MGAANVAVAESTERGDSRDAMIWRLEEGTTLMFAGRTEESLEAFDKAESIVDYWDTQADVRLGDETGAALTNLAMLPYRGRAYDKIMMNTYKAINYLRLQDFPAARVELNRALEQQREAVRKNAERLEEAQEEAKATASQENGFNAGKAASDPTVEAKLQDNVSEAMRLATYTDYVNPFTVWLDGLYFSYHSTGGSDYERARKSLERVKGMAPAASDLIDAELTRLEGRVSGKKAEPIVYVIFETGRGPWRKEFRVDIPLLAVTDEVSYFGAAFPTMEVHFDWVPALQIESQGEVLGTTLPICSMDSVVATDFQNEWPIIVTKTLVSAGTKALASYLAKEAVKDSGSDAALFMNIATAIYQAAVNKADLRTWSTIPKEIQVAAVPLPESRILRLVPSNNTATPVEVPLTDDPVQVVHVRSVKTYTPMLTYQFPLR